jgi:hypothetical protein
MVYLGKAAYLQLIAFENLSAAVATAPTAAAKERLTRAASLTLARQHGLTAEIIRAGGVPGDVMGLYSEAIDDFSDRVAGKDWFETLISCHIAAGFIDDFLARLAEGLPKGYAERVAEVLTTDSGAELIATEIAVAIDASPLLASRLAMWGRRLVGDTMLITRYVLEETNPAEAANGAEGSNAGAQTAGRLHSFKGAETEARIEPIFNELIAAHTRRMDALGLTA